MTESVTEEALIRSIRSRLPQLLRSDPSLGDYIPSVTREHFPTKEETEDRFTRMLNELARDREAQSRKWEEQNRKWEESNRCFDETDRRIDRSIGALGARWGMQPERAFRDALAGILVESFGVKVINRSCHWSVAFLVWSGDVRCGWRCRRDQTCGHPWAGAGRWHRSGR